MNERLLQYIWQMQYFNKNELETVGGETLSIIYPGYYNTNQGPDFLEGRIKIDHNTWVGNIELHVNASDWKKHLHSMDPNYKNVILHVIWKDDDQYPSHEIPTLVLADRVPKLLLQQYDQWMKSGSFVPCGHYLYYAEEIVWTSWKERLLIERLDRKYQQVKLFLEQNNYNWEETFWWMLARSYGLQVNAEAFEEIARSVPFDFLLKHKNNPDQLEELLLTRAELINIPLHFLRMRPAAFPNVRLKQLAALIVKHDQLFQAIINTKNTGQLKSIFPLAIIINAVVPILFAYGREQADENYITKAIELMGSLSAEKNAITIQFKKMEIGSKTAADSQSLIELKTQYCDHRRCLDCAIGNAVLKKRC